MTAKKLTCGTGLKISILYYMTASQASFLTSLIDKFHNCNKNRYFPAMHTKLDLKIIIIILKTIKILPSWPLSKFLLFV